MAVTHIHTHTPTTTHKNLTDTPSPYQPIKIKSLLYAYEPCTSSVQANAKIKSIYVHSDIDNMSQLQNQCSY